MKTARTRPPMRSGLPRLLLLIPIALALIAGLLTMHTLSGANASLPAGTSAVSPQMQVMGANTGVGHAMTSTWHATVDAQCHGECSDPMGMPEHSMLMMVCVLALLTAALVLLAPALLTRLEEVLARARQSGVRVDARAVLARPRPPSLIVLSISRT